MARLALPRSTSTLQIAAARSRGLSSIITPHHALQVSLASRNPTNSCDSFTRECGSGPLAGPLPPQVQPKSDAPVRSAPLVVKLRGWAPLTRTLSPTLALDVSDRQDQSWRMRWWYLILSLPPTAQSGVAPDAFRHADALSVTLPAPGGPWKSLATPGWDDWQLISPPVCRVVHKSCLGCG